MLQEDASPDWTSCVANGSTFRPILCIWFLFLFQDILSKIETLIHLLLLWISVKCNPNMHQLIIMENFDNELDMILRIFSGAISIQLIIINRNKKFLLLIKIRDLSQSSHLLYIFIIFI